MFSYIFKNILFVIYKKDSRFIIYKKDSSLVVQFSGRYLPKSAKIMSVLANFTLGLWKYLISGFHW